MLPSRRLSPSPSPPPAELPSFLPQKGANSTEHPQMKEQEMKMKFRQFWMSSVADGFRDDLEEIRKVSHFSSL
jgi:ribosome assembly protein 3